MYFTSEVVTRNMVINTTYRYDELKLVW